MSTCDPLFRVANATRDSLVSRRARKALATWSRLVGLLGQDAFGTDDGLLLRPSSGVHTFGMRFAIDVVALDAGNTVLGVWSNVAPGRVAGIHWRTRSVLELPAGYTSLSGTQRGDQLLITPAAP